LAEADEQRKAQEAAAAATAVAAAYQPVPQEAPPPDRDLFGEGSLARRISQLPGEAEPPATASNPWLSRREGAELAQADVWSRPKAGDDRRLVDDETYEQSAVAQTVVAQLEQPATASAAVPTEDSEDNKIRLVLLIAAAVSVAALAAYLFMTGSL